jgi:hypothetical protein
LSEYISTYFEVGGKLPASLIDAFLNVASDDINNMIGPDTREELLELDNEICRFDGTANYGLCNELSKFCREHDLPFITHSEVCIEYNADTTFWLPGMEEPETFYTDANNNPIVPFNDISPLVRFMYAVIIDGKNALPIFINDECSRVKDLVAVGLDKGYPEFLIKLQGAIEEALPQILPELPPLVIDMNA